MSRSPATRRRMRQLKTHKAKLKIPKLKDRLHLTAAMLHLPVKPRPVKVQIVTLGRKVKNGNKKTSRR